MISHLIAETAEISRPTAAVQVSHFLIIRIIKKYGRTFSNPAHKQINLLVCLRKQKTPEGALFAETAGISPSAKFLSSQKFA